jgi:hypothetical protein
VRLGQHCIGRSDSLYEAFPTAEARRLVERFEWHYTPKHGGWLNKAESELSVLSGQCLDRRILDKQTLTEEGAAWEHARTTSCCSALRRRKSCVQVNHVIAETAG